MKHLLYIIGEPGVGKSTLVETLTGGTARAIVGRTPMAHLIYLTEAGGVTELGAREPGRFGGTDALAMNAITKAVEWLHDESWPEGAMLLAEGDRLACDRFFNEALSAGWELRIAHLGGDPAVAAARRAERGSAQNEIWLKGRISKVRGIIDRWDWTGKVRSFDSRQAPTVTAEAVAAWSPVARALLAQRGLS